MCVSFWWIKKAGYSTMITIFYCLDSFCFPILIMELWKLLFRCDLCHLYSSPGVWCNPILCFIRNLISPFEKQKQTLLFYLHTLLCVWMGSRKIGLGKLLCIQIFWRDIIVQKNNLALKKTRLGVRRKLHSNRSLKNQ